MTALNQAPPFGEFCLGFYAEPSTATVICRLTERALESWNLPHLVDDAIVIINEFATNAILAASGFWIEIRLKLRAEGVFLECWDPTSELPTALREADSFTTSRPVTHYGVKETAYQEGKTLWALLSLSAVEAAA